MYTRSSCLENILEIALLDPATPYDEVVKQAADHPDGAVGVRGCDDALADDLGWAYVAAAHSAVADLPGGPRGYQVLSAAAQGTVGSQLALAQHLGVDRTVMTYLLDDLEAEGLIERRTDPADRRARRVVATERGTELLATLDDRLRAAEAQLLAPLEVETGKAFRAQIQLLATRISAIDPLDSPCDLAQQVDAELPGPRRPVPPAGAR
jgi:DNA-binding MarR family transcriptional regulator